VLSRRRRLPTTASAATLLFVLSACGNPAQQTLTQALKDSRAVTFPAPGHVRLAGRLFGSESDAAGVVLASEYTSDQRNWFDLADRLASQGYRVLTFDYRGVCPGGAGGCSQGTKDAEAMPGDIAAAAAYLRSVGTLRLGIVGAVEGGTAALVTASHPIRGLTTVVTLSAPQTADGVVAGPTVLQAITVAKKFIAGEADPTGSQAAQAFYDESLPPKAVLILTTADRGTALLEGNQSEQARNAIVLSMEQYVPTSTPSASP